MTEKAPMRLRAPRYRKGMECAGLVSPGSEVIIYSAVSSKTKSPYRATVVDVRQTVQEGNPAVVLRIPLGQKFRYESIGGGTSVTVLNGPQQT